MGKTLSPSIARRLKYAKYLFDLGRRQLRSNTNLGACVAVLHFHDALELLLICILEEHSVARKRVTSFPELINLIRKEIGSIKRENVVSQLTGLRNPLKHEGILPNVAEVRRLVPEIELLVQENSRQYLKIDFRDVRLADMLMDDTVRDSVRAAEDLIEEGNNVKAVAFLQHAFQRLIEHCAYATAPALAWEGRTKELLSHFYTRPAAEFCLQFVIETALEIQSLAKIRDPHGRYTIEVVVAEAPIFRLVKNEGLSREGVARRGERFTNAKFVVVMAKSAGEGGDMWGIDDEPFGRFLRLDDVEIRDDD